MVKYSHCVQKFAAISVQGRRAPNANLGPPNFPLASLSFFLSFLSPFPPTLPSPVRFFFQYHYLSISGSPPNPARWSGGAL